MLHIEQKILLAIVSHVESGQEELCGFFFGSEQGEDRTVTKSVIVENVSPGNKQSSFEISARDYLQAESTAEHEKLTLLGAYHSHPNGSSHPSEQDLLAAQPNFSYIIVSVMQQRFSGMRCWQLTNQKQFREEEIVYIQSLNT